MSPTLSTALLALLIVPATTHAAALSGSVITVGAQPVAGATVQVVDTPCRTTAAADGTFSFTCERTGRHVVRATFGDLRPWQIDDVELAPDHTVHLNFMLLPATAVALPAPALGDSADTETFLTREIPNPLLATWGDRPITLRMVAIAVAAVSFPLGVFTMLALGRRFGIQTRRLSAGELGDLVLNPHRPEVGERVTPVAVAGARGAEARVSFGADEIADALAARRYGLVFVAVLVVPVLFALFSVALAVAMLVGQESYLLYGMLLVPAGFLLTPIMIGWQAWQRRAQAS